MSTTTGTATITYRKTKTGEWVAYGPAAAMHEGPVTVTKRDGTTKTERIARLGRPFLVDGREMVYGYLAPKQAKQSWSGRCAAGRRYVCEDCGDWVTAGDGSCWETGMQH